MADDLDPLCEETQERLAWARCQKTKVEIDLREGYFFAAPHRSREVQSTTSQIDRFRPNDAGELNTSFAMELSGDFVTLLINTFFPQGEQWAMSKPAQIVQDENLQKQIQEQATNRDRAVFGALSESNFYPECGKGLNPDAALGTVAIWVDLPAPHRPLKFQTVPLRELEISLGPDGDVDDRFVVRHTRFKHIKAILPGVKMPAAVSEKMAASKDKTCEVVRGFWRLYQDDGSIEWQYVATVDGHVVDKKVIKGEGSCPLIVARFNPSGEFAWGEGPLIQALPDLRMIDELAMKRVRGIDLTMEPPIGFPDDSFANISEGLEPGMAYPIRPGSEDAIKNIYNPPSQDPAIYFTNDQETRLKRIFFLDYPDQPGKTPPTATQWLDQMTMAQRRFGTPGLPFWFEFCAGIFTRAEYLLEKAGIIKLIAIGGKATKGVTRLHPYNPAEKAIEQQKVAQFARFVQIVGQAFPEEFKIASDGTKTIDKLSVMMGVSEIWIERPDDQKQAAIAAIQKLAGGQAPGAPTVPDGQPVPQPSPGPAAITPTVQLRSKSA